MKVAKACKQCRESKRRCVRPADSSPRCTPCARRQLPCSLATILSAATARNHRPAAILPQPPPPPPSQLPLSQGAAAAAAVAGSPSSAAAAAIGCVPPRQSVVDELVDLYVTLIHDKPHSLFHEPSLRQAAAAGTVSPAVLFGILGLAARFHGDASVQARGPGFAAEAKRLLKQDLENICLENIQASILVANTCGAANEANSEALFFGLAIRMAQILQLPQSAPGDDAVRRETRRRIYWTLYMVDRWNSAGLGLTRQLPDACDDESIMPVHEGDFHRPDFNDLVYDDDNSSSPPSPSSPSQNPPDPEDQGDAAETSGEGWSSSSSSKKRRKKHQRRRGLWAYMIDLAATFSAIQDLHRQHVTNRISDAVFEASAQALAASLEAFAERLPPRLRLTLDNLRAHAAAGLGRTFVALHLGYHHYATLVHFAYLDIAIPRSPRQQVFASRCRHHADTFSDLLKLSAEERGCEAVYNIVGHMTVVSSSVLLHTLFFGEEGELPMARLRLEENFRVLVRLRGWWPSVGIMMDRLFTFQKVCMWSVDPNTHKIDKWMLKFLLQHALPIEEKQVDGGSGGAAFVRQQGQAPDVPAGAEISSERGRFATSALSMLRS